MDGSASRWRRWWPLVALLVVSAVARFAVPDRFPAGFAQHAVSHNELAIEFMEAMSARCTGIVVPFPGITQQFGLMSLLQGVTFLVLGVGFRQAMVLAALFGVLAVVVAFAAGRELGDRRLGLVSAAMLATAPWHLAFSRYGDAEHSLPVLQFLLTLWLAHVSVRRRSVTLALVLGMVASLSWYVYGTNQVVPVMLLLWLPLLVSRFGFPGWRWPAGFVASLAASSWPAVARSLEHGFIYPVRAGLEREGAYELLGPVEMLEQLPEALRQLFVESTDRWFTRPGGVFPVVGAVLLVGGVVLLVGAVRRPATRQSALLLLGTLALALLPGLTISGTGARRLLLVPTVAVFVQGSFVVWLFDRPALALLTRRRRHVLAAAVAIGWLGWGIVDYLARVGQSESAGHRHHRDVARLVAGDLGAGHVAVLGADPADANDMAAFIRFAAYRDLRRVAAGGGPPALPFSTVDATAHSSLASVCAALPAGASERRRVIMPAALAEVVSDRRDGETLDALVSEVTKQGRRLGPVAWEAPCPLAHFGAGERP